MVIIGSITKRAKDSPAESADKNISIANEKASIGMKDITKTKVLDEKYRQGVEKLWKGIATIPKNWNDMTIREQRDWTNLQVNRHMTNLPKSLNALAVGWTVKGDCGRSVPSPKPDWYDEEKFLRGQRFAIKNIASVMFNEVLSVFGLYSFEDVLRPMFMTGRSNNPFNSHRRYLSTTVRLKSWYSSDPFTEGTEAYKDIQIVRKVHAMISAKLIDTNPEELEAATTIEDTWSPTHSALQQDFRDSCPAAAPGQRPYAFSKEDVCKRPVGITQSEIAVTQTSLICFVILNPELIGIHDANKEDLEAFVHVWRCVGYLLGMDDEFNFCNGTLEDVQQRSRDVLEYWMKPNFRDIRPEWEHVMRSIVGGIRLWIPLINYEQVILHLAVLLNIRLPQFEATVRYHGWLHYKLMRILIDWLAKMEWVRRAVNAVLFYCMNRGFNFNQKKLTELKKQSRKIMSNGIEETAAAQENLKYRKFWPKNFSFFILVAFTICLLATLTLVAN